MILLLFLLCIGPKLPRFKLCYIHLRWILLDIRMTRECHWTRVVFLSPQSFIESSGFNSIEEIPGIQCPYQLFLFIDKSIPGSMDGVQPEILNQPAAKSVPN